MGWLKNQNTKVNTPLLIMPRFYYCKRGKSDREDIAKKMQEIPPEHRQEVADQYEKLFLSTKRAGGDRRGANRYLAGVAEEYRIAEYSDRQKGLVK